MAEWVWARSAAEARTKAGGKYVPSINPQTGKQSGWMVYAEGEPVPEDEETPEGEPTPVAGVPPVSVAPSSVPSGEGSPQWGGAPVWGVGGGSAGGGSAGGGSAGGGGSMSGEGRFIPGASPMSAGYSSGTSISGPVIGESGIEKFLKKFQKGFKRADYSNIYQQMLEAVGQQTTQRQQDIRQAFSEQQAQQQAKLQRVGLGGTTVGSTMNLGIARERESELNRLADQMLSQKLGVLGGQAGRQYGLQSQYLGLIGQLATVPTSESIQKNVRGAIGGAGQFYGPSGGTERTGGFSRAGGY